MKSSAKKIELASVDDLFTTEQERQQAGEERVVRIPLSQLHYFKGYSAMQTEVPFTGQPYRVKDNDPKMLETLDSVRQRGVRTPGLVRPDPEGGYEIISGHRRHRASELAGLEDMPVIIREMNDEEAVIEMVDANIQREDVLPSEKAWAYRMKLEAIKRQGERTDLTSAQVGPKLTAAEKIAENSPDSKSQVKRYIRLTELIPELLDMVDEKKIALNPAYELSFLKKEEQVDLLDAMDSEQATPSLSQAQRLKKFSQEGHLSIDVMRAIKHGETDAYWLSDQANFSCKVAIEQAISTHYGDNRLDTASAVQEVMEKFGPERMNFILANTIQHKDADGRISRDNKAWAKTIPMPEDKESFRRNAYLVVDQVNPGLVDLFTRQARKTVQEKEKGSVLQMLKQELPAHKPAAPKKQGPER